MASGLTPKLRHIGVTNNPARTATTFLISHDRRGSRIDVTVEVFNTSGRLCWSRVERGVSTENTYRVDWDLRQNDGTRMQPGIYIYRVKVACDGSKSASKSEKLIIVGNKS